MILCSSAGLMNANEKARLVCLVKVLDGGWKISVSKDIALGVLISVKYNFRF